MVKKLAREFYLQDTLTAAKELLGHFLVRVDAQGEAICGMITETEAYIGATDKACHAYGGRRTPRTEPLFAAGGISYVYLIYGMYHCFNVVTEAENVPSAVLVRGVAIVSGQEAAAQNRYGRSFAALTPKQRRDMSNGPGKLCRALAIDKSLNRADLRGEELFIAEEFEGRKRTAAPMITSKRIGIDYAEEAKDFPWRFQQATEPLKERM